jgi:hydroxyquinol 1,2-dioxygenase
MRNLNEHNITDAVVARFADTPNPRVKEIITSLVQHLHAFARETKLTEAEWMEGIKFLTATGQKCDDVRQEFILLSDTIGLSQLVVAQNHSRAADATEQTVFGPFHIENPPKKKDGEDIAMGAPGEPCLCVTQVVDQAGKPVPNVQVDVWQADAEGFYDVQDPTWNRDKMRLRAVFNADKNGELKFWTIKPAAYPVPTDGPVGAMLTLTNRHPMRPGHIHFAILEKGYDPLITHVFIDNDPYLDSDAVFGVRSSCIGDYVRHEAGTAPDGSVQQHPYYTLNYKFVLAPEIAHA